jgi:hypothetical protein
LAVKVWAGLSPLSNDHAHLARKADRDRMVDGGEIGLAHAVAQAGLDDAAGAVDAQPRHHVARPAAATGLLREGLLGGEDAAGAGSRDVPVEILDVAKQPETVLHLPRNADIGRDVARRDRKLRGGRAAGKPEDEQRADRGQRVRHAAEGGVGHRASLGASLGLSGAHDQFVMRWGRDNGMRRKIRATA